MPELILFQKWFNVIPIRFEPHWCFWWTDSTFFVNRQHFLVNRQHFLVNRQRFLNTCATHSCTTKKACTGHKKYLYNGLREATKALFIFLGLLKILYSPIYEITSKFLTFHTFQLRIPIWGKKVLTPFKALWNMGLKIDHGLKS